VKRRKFITLLGGAAAAWSLAARAQQGERMRRIGVLMSRSGSFVVACLAARPKLRHSLTGLGR
jgi:putative ABC transport system substrate-binding protein